MQHSWAKLFPPQILSRGQAYYESELVEIEAMDEQSIEATVEGTELYSVEIILQGDHVAEMNCDCPYAEGGNNCKHMAAVLFAAEDMEAFPPSVRSAGAWEQALTALSEEQLRTLLADAARRHADIQDRIVLMSGQVVGPALHRRWEADLREISRRASDRHGLIDYDHASNYSLELQQYLEDAIEPLLENGLVMDAFVLVGLVFAEAMTQEIDDSNGELSEIDAICREYWEKLLPAPEADRARMLDWFQAQLRRFSGDVGEDFLWPFVLSHFMDETLLPRVLSMLDSRIASTDRYSQRWLIERRLVLMEEAGAAPEEIDAYRKRFWSLPFIRGQALDRLEAEGNWAGVLTLLDECEELDREYRSLLASYSARRIRILKQSGPECAWLEALKRHIFGFPQRELTFISELKEAVPSDQWPSLLEKLFQNENTRGLRRQLQLSEGLLDQMMAELEESGSAYELRQYEIELREVHPERVRDLLLKQVDQQMRQASTRDAYAAAARALKHLYGYPEGQERASALAAAWRADFPRRSAMLDELRKAKL